MVQTRFTKLVLNLLVTFMLRACHTHADHLVPTIVQQYLYCTDVLHLAQTPPNTCTAHLKAHPSSHIPPRFTFLLKTTNRIVRISPYLLIVLAGLTIIRLGGRTPRSPPQNQNGIVIAQVSPRTFHFCR